MRARLTLAVALAAAMSAIAVAPMGAGIVADSPLPLWAAGSFVTAVHAQAEPVQEPAPVEDPRPEPEQANPVEDVQEVQEVQEPPEEAEAEPAPEPEPQPETVEQEPEPEPEMNLGDFWSVLQTEITAEAAHQVTVGASTDALEAARQNLVDAEQAHDVAMDDQGGHTAGIRAAAQAFVDFLTLAYLQPQE